MEEEAKKQMSGSCLLCARRSRMQVREKLAEVVALKSLSKNACVENIAHEKERGCFEEDQEVW